jgi:protein-S-isoprenylcysteine O-methyltransferase Ste14
MSDENQPGSAGALPVRSASTTRVFTEGWDFVLTSRILPACFFLIAALARISGLLTFLRTTEQSGRSLVSPTVVLFLWAKVSTILFFVMLVGLYVVRLRPIGKAQTLWPKAIALVGTFMMSFVALLPQPEPGMPVMIVVGLLLIGGYGITILALAMLGRSVSIMPEARRLVRRGLYAHVRHPMYLGEMVFGAGMALEAFSPLAAILFVGFVWAQIQRTKYEEAVLQQVFPDYSEYKARTARLIPKIY